MPTLIEVLRQSIQRLGPSVGRTEAVASLTTTTVVATTLASGGLGGERYRNYWMMRLNAASSADYFRRVTSFTASSGTLTHAGTNYSDTTATSEYVDLLSPDLEPYLLFNAAQEVIPQIKRLDVLEMPVYGGDRYNLGAYPYIRSDSDIKLVTWRPTAELGRNRGFERWNGYDTSGNLTADHWAVSGGATYTRSTTGVRKGRYSAAMVRASSDGYLLQTVGLLDDGVDSLAGETVTVVLRCQTATASAFRVYINDGTATTNSSYHTGGGTVEELSATMTLASTATTLTFGIEGKVDGTCYIDECYILKASGVTDTDRRGQFIESPVNPYWLKDGGTVTAQLPGRAIGSGQYLFYAIRGFPAFDATRLAARTAGPDTTDAPILIAALGIAGLVFRQLQRRRGGDHREEGLAEETWAQFEAAALDYYTKNLPADGAVEIPRRQYSIPAHRFAGRRG